MAKKLPNDALLTEILQSASSAKTKAEKIKILQEYNNNGLRALLIINFDESLKFMLPEGEVPFKRNDAPMGTEHTMLEREGRNLWRFIKDANTLTRFKREQLFIQLLEGLHESEADIICLVKDKQLHKKYRITKAVVTSAFPNIQWSE